MNISSAARSIERLEQAKAAAEETTARLLALQRMTAALSDATNQSAVAAIIVEHLGAILTNCRPLIATVSADGEHVEYVRDVTHLPTTTNRYGKLHISSAAPITDCIRTKTTIILQTPDEIRQRYPNLLLVTESEEVGSIMAMPFVVDGRAIGGLVFDLLAPNTAISKIKISILHVAHTCMQCLERARLHERNEWRELKSIRSDDVWDFSPKRARYSMRPSTHPPSPMHSHTSSSRFSPTFASFTAETTTPDRISKTSFTRALKKNPSCAAISKRAPRGFAIRPSKKCKREKRFSWIT